MHRNHGIDFESIHARFLNTPLIIRRSFAGLIFFFFICLESGLHTKIPIENKFFIHEQATISLKHRPFGGEISIKNNVPKISCQPQNFWSVQFETFVIKYTQTLKTKLHAENVSMNFSRRSQTKAKCRRLCKQQRNVIDFKSIHACFFITA